MLIVWWSDKTSTRKMSWRLLRNNVLLNSLIELFCMYILGVVAMPLRIRHHPTVLLFSQNSPSRIVGSFRNNCQVSFGLQLKKVGSIPFDHIHLPSIVCIPSLYVLSPLVTASAKWSKWLLFSVKSIISLLLISRMQKKSTFHDWS